MAETKIKVNELPSATPTLNDTLVGSNATKEYACKIEDLASLIGGGSTPEAEVIAPSQVLTITSETTGPVSIALAEGKSINPDLWAVGGYYITVEKIDEPIMHKTIIPLITEQVNHTYSVISYGYEYPTTQLIDDPNYSVWSFDVSYDLKHPTMGIGFYVATYEDDEWVPVPGSYRISVVIPGCVKDCVYPKLLIHNDNEDFFWTTNITIGEGPGYIVDSDITSLNYVPKVMLNNMGIFGGFAPFGMRPITCSPQDTSYGGFVLMDWCMGLEAFTGNGDSFALIPNTASVEYISENIGG